MEKMPYPRVEKKAIKYCKHSHPRNKTNFHCDFVYYAPWGIQCDENWWFWNCKYNKDKTTLALRKLKGEE